MKLLGKCRQQGLHMQNIVMAILVIFYYRMVNKFMVHQQHQ
jgi:hypothetical protein